MPLLAWALRHDLRPRAWFLKQPDHLRDPATIGQSRRDEIEPSPHGSIILSSEELAFLSTSAVAEFGLMEATG
jgi:hypothetical protein